MKLKVPHFEQQKNLSCGLASLRMLFGYYGDNVEERELAQSVKMHSFGTFFTDLAGLAIDRNYKVTCYTFHLSILGPLQLAFGTRITQKQFNKLDIRPSDKMIFSSWKRYLKKNGKLVWETPRISQLEYWLNKNTPCLISVNTTALRNFWKKWDNGHFLIVRGIDKNKNIDVLDSDLSKEKASYRISSDILLPAWAINARQGSSFLMVIEK